MSDASIIYIILILKHVLHYNTRHVVMHQILNILLVYIRFFFNQIF